MKTSKILAGALSLSGLMFIAAVQAAPSAGAYVTDTQNTWVQDRVGDRISTVNMIMCIIGALKPESMVNQGSYLALVDQQKCSGKSDSSKAITTNEGAANSSNYMSAVVNATQPTSADPLIVKAWMTQEERRNGGTNKSLIYAYVEATAGKSAANPNGIFKMYFCGTAAIPGNTTCMFKGTLKSDSSGLTFYEADTQGASTSETKLKLQQSDATGDNGIGKMQGVENGPYAYSFAYNPTYFRRSDNIGTDSCFARDQSRAEFSTWRYGTYKQDGSRLSMNKPGFPVKFVDNGTTNFGYWGFWGLSLPPSALANIGAPGTALTRQVGGADEALTVTKKGGKLWKLTRQQSTLDDFKNTPLNYSACQQTASLPAAGDPPCTNYALQWNGTNLQAVSKTTCGNSGCSPAPLNSPINLTSSEFTAKGANSLWIYSPAGDGVISVPQSGNFSGTTSLFYRTRNAVVPGSAGAPSGLLCVNSCPATYANVTPIAPWSNITSLTWGGGSTQTILSSQNWGPVPVGNAIGYTFDGLLKSAGSAIDYSAASQSQMGQYQGGLQSGYLIDANDATALGSIKCDNSGVANSSGSNYCPWLANQAPTSYQWETGPNQWNQYFGAANAAGAITFDSPKSLSIAVAANSSNIRIRSTDVAKYAGSTMQLQFSGFGELQGIPGNCVDPDSNLPTSCGPSVRWVPAFDILDGSMIAEGSTSYFVKYLEREMRLLKVTGSEDTSCKAALSISTANALTLPGSDAVDVNALTKIGSQPTLTTDKPSVIHGVLQ